MDEAFVVRNQVALSCKGSHVVLHAAEKKAVAMRVPVCIAVVDAGGELLAFTRMDGARPASVEIALTKARSAARRRRATADETQGESALRLALASRMNTTAVGGGLPIVVDGQVAGAIGVSSGTTDEDIQVAQAGIDALSSA